MKTMEAIISDQDITISNLEARIKILEKDSIRSVGSLELAQEYIDRDKDLRRSSVYNKYSKLYEKIKIKSIDDELSDESARSTTPERKALQFSRKKYLTDVKRRNESIKLINKERSEGLRAILTAYNEVKGLEDYIFNGVVYGSGVSNKLYQEYQTVQKEIYLRRQHSALQNRQNDLPPVKNKQGNKPKTAPTVY